MSKTPGPADDIIVPATRLHDLSGFDVPHPDPFVVEVSVGRRSVSQVIAHVANDVYVGWLDRAAELHADALGFTRRSMLEQNMMWFVARHEIDYRAEAMPGDALLIVTWVREIRRVKTWREYRIIRPADGTVVNRAATLWVLVNLDTRRPMTIPTDMATRFAPITSAGGAGRQISVPLRES